MSNFDPKKYLIRVQGNREYLPVAARLIWFRQEHPDWGISTRSLAIDLEKQYAIFEATITNAEGRIMAMGTKMENVKGFGDYLEKAETGSIGRALALCGFGTQFAPELDAHPEHPHIVDSPQQTRQAPAASFRTNQNRPSAALPGSATQRPGLPVAGYDGHEPDPFGDGQLTPTQPVQASPLTCEGCSKNIKEAQASLSWRKFGKPLCPDCQKAATLVERRAV